MYLLKQQIHQINPLWIKLIIIGIVVSFPVFIIGLILLPTDYFVLMIGLLVAAPIGIILLNNPQILAAMTVIVFPLERADFFDSILPGSLTIGKLLGLLLLGAILFNIVFRKEKFRFFDDTLDYAVCLFCGAILFSSIPTLHIEQILDEFDRIFRLVAFYFAVKNLADDPKIIFIMLLGLFITSIYAAWYGINYASNTTTEWGKLVRAAGINEQPNNFGMFSIIAMSIGYYLMQISPRLWVKLLYIAGILILLWGIILSGSRGSMISLSVIIMLIVLRHPKRLQLLIILPLIALSIVPVLPENIRSRYLGSEGDFGDSYSAGAEFSIERRSSYIVLGLDLISRRPIQGFGYRTFSQHYPTSEFARYDNPLSAHETFRIAHNIYMETFTGTGLIGLLALLGMFFVAWRTFYNTSHLFPPNTTAWAAAHGLEYALICFMISSVFISSEQFKQLWFLYGISSALLHYAHSQGLKPVYSPDEKLLAKIRSN